MHTDKSPNRSFGFEVMSGTYVDMLKAGIIALARVTRDALRNAASMRRSSPTFRVWE
jgi:chaperonin GroEL (HSP60 family)